MTSITGNSFLDTLTKSGGTSSGSTTTAKSSQTIDQSGFLKLLTAQMQTQDPTAPTDNSQMVQQMATFSQVAGITEMNTSLKSMATDISAQRFGSASGLIGHAALVDSGTAAALSNGAYAGEITLPASASDVTLSLVDGNGQTVYAKDLGAKAAGAVDWSWDGKDQSGNAVAGPLKMIVSAKGATGGSMSPTVSAWTEVQGVQSPATGTTKLTTALGSFAPSAVRQIS